MGNPGDFQECPQHIAHLRLLNPSQTSGKAPGHQGSRNSFTPHLGALQGQDFLWGRAGPAMSAQISAGLGHPAPPRVTAAVFLAPCPSQACKTFPSCCFQSLVEHLGALAGFFPVFLFGFLVGCAPDGGGDSGGICSSFGCLCILERMDQGIAGIQGFRDKEI